MHSSIDQDVVLEKGAWKRGQPTDNVLLAGGCAIGWADEAFAIVADDGRRSY